MVSMVVGGKVFIEVSEVLTYLGGLRADILTQKEECISDYVHIKDLDPQLKVLADKVTNMDYDFFIDKIDFCIQDLSRHLQNGKWSNKIPKKLQVKK